MFGKGDSSNRQKINGCSFQQVLRQAIFGLVFVFTQKTLFLRGFILEPTERA